MSAEQLVVLALIVAAFAAGWVARGSGDDEEEAATEGGDDRPPRRRLRRRRGASGDAAAVADAAPAASASAASSTRTAAAPTAVPQRADPVADAARALALASAAYEKAVDRWLDERDAITPAGRAVVGEVERAVQRLDAASARLDELDHPLADAAWDALDALREATRHLAAFREGAAMDAPTSRALDRIDDDLERARGAFARPAA